MKGGLTSNTPSVGVELEQYEGGLLPLDPNSPINEEIFRNGNIAQDYEVEKDPIARGKFAAVRRARHRTTGQMFAAKYIRRRRTATNQEKEALHEIAVLLLGISDHNIIRLHQWYQTRSEYIIVLEFASGGDLQRILDEQLSLPESTVRIILRQVLQGLRFLHIHQIAHLDIKPQNLVLMGEKLDSEVKLVDFGLSRRINQGVDLSIIMGTPDYMAPEVINYEAVDLATDMWAIGVLTYVLLTGCTPFGGDTDQDTFVNITQGDYDLPDDLFGDVSTFAKDFINSLLVQRKRERLTVDECLTHPWMCSSLIEEPLYTPESHDLYSVPENETEDSAYSSDSNGSPTNGFTTSLNIPDLCQYSIPEEQHQNIIAPTENNHRNRTMRTFLSAEMEDTLHSNIQRPHKRSTRHASLILDGYGDTRINKIRNGVNNYLARDSDLDSDFEDPRINNSRNCYNGYYENGDQGVVYWDDYSDLNSKKCISQYDQASLINLAKPWEKLCNGSVSRAKHQLTVKNVPKKTENSLNEIEVNNIETDMCLMNCDYNPQIEPVSNLQMTNPILRASIADIRLTKCDSKPSKSDLKRGSRNDLRSSRNDLRNSKRDIRNTINESKTKNKTQQKSEHKTLQKTKSEYRENRRGLKKSDISASNFNLNQPRSNFWGYHSSRSLSQLNTSLSLLDLAHHETLNSEPVDSEERDIVYSDLTLPRRKLDKNGLSNLRRGNSIHMSFRMPRKRDMKM